MSLMLDTWREIGRNLELATALRQLMPRLADEIPVAMILVRHIDVAGGGVETIAFAATDQNAAAPPARNRQQSPINAEVIAWCRRQQVVHSLTAIKELALLPSLPEGLPGRGIAVAGLCLEQDRNPEVEPKLGLLILLPKDGADFTAGHLSLIGELIEPFSVALANDHHVRELKTFREAAEAENRALLTRLHRESVSDTIVGAESGLASVMERVELVARSEAPVLILGETGTGKEVVARAIHSRSKRSQGPMIRVNCGAIPSELVDSELFGHERGSFTGAASTRKGWFERADGGTLFLDEIGELPLAAQVRLLRVLQDGTFERVGAQTVLTVNVRLIAATHSDLHAMVQQRAFREDLWYRISVFPIHLPTLRERPGDIAAMTTHFALKSARRLGLPPALPTQDDLTLLAAYSWPGNVRELASVIERAAILGNGKYLEVAKALGTGMTAQSPAPSPAAQQPPPQTSLDHQASRHIESSLAACHGRIEGPFGAAKMLGINPHTLRSRMRKLGIDWKRFRPGSHG
ncbi:MAG: sigma 54-interacting transcriptional regulator [Tepidisphaeraceae bacterium]|jgi:transcriptional regulator with GAF, ATPase, and Fis domain